jgi:hypothetical protein
MSKGDFDAIMDTLSDDQRGKVIALLEELEEGGRSEVGSAGEPKLDHSPLLVPDKLSPWLVARVNGNPAAGDEVVEQFSMTTQATVALRLCAAELVPQPQTKSARPSLFERLWQRLVVKQSAA